MAGSLSVRQRGFTYITVLLALAILAAVLAATADIWHTTRQREKERELLFIGNQFRMALAGYFAKNRRFPTQLEQLLLDDHSPAVRRFLRRIYVDPMTGKAPWGTVTLPDGPITGVFSLSDGEPLKQAGFRQRDSDFEGKGKYSEWVFSGILKPLAAVTQPQAGQAAVPPKTTTGILHPGL